jgi:hypothetical protein
VNAGLAAWREDKFRERSGHFNQHVDPVDMYETLAVHARHGRVHLGDHPLGGIQSGRRDVDGDA